MTETVLKLVPMTKICSLCKVAKSHSLFSKNKGTKYGISADCKDCRNAKRTEKRKIARAYRESMWTAPVNKVCSRCKIEKDVSEFGKNGDRKIGITPDCKQCRNARYKDPRKNRKDRLPAMYGVDYDHVVRTLINQHGLCANRACGKEISLTVPMGPNRAVIDHDHKTGKFRAVLCMMCNTMLGNVEKDKNRILGLIEYAEKHNNTVDLTSIDNFNKGS